MVLDVAQRSYPTCDALIRSGSEPASAAERSERLEGEFVWFCLSCGQRVAALGCVRSVLSIVTGFRAGGGGIWLTLLAGLAGVAASVAKFAGCARLKRAGWPP
jgi:hypothetical protein